MLESLSIFVDGSREASRFICRLFVVSSNFSAESISPMLIVLASEHRLNFRQLLESASALRSAQTRGEVKACGSSNLLQFYAAEVGLKYLLNKTAKIPFKHEVAKKTESVEGFSHDLNAMVARLKIPAARIPSTPKASYRCVPGFDTGSGGQTFTVTDSHQAWRYGLTIQAADEAALLSYVQSIVTYLTAEIS